VTLPSVHKLVEAGRFSPGPSHQKAADMMLDELKRWTDALAVLRRR
jgi:hypothetical protein